MGKLLIKMTRKINHDQKETAIESLRVHGTMRAAAQAAGVSVSTLNEEMKRSAIYRKRILEAREEGKRNVADNAIERIKEYAFNPPPKTDRNVLTAAIALANAYEAGFRGTTTIQGSIDHNLRVKTGIPRPKYDLIEPQKEPAPKKLKKTIEGKVVKSKAIQISEDEDE